MEKPVRLTVSIFVLVALATIANSTRADFEVTGPDGRGILLKEDGTWQYLQERRPVADSPKPDGEATLVLERMGPYGYGCKLAVRLENKLPYEIRSLIPYYSVYRPDGVIYDTSSGGQGFGSIKPGDTQSREIEFPGIQCKAISRIQVVGGSRCQMGDLDRFSATSEQCLARVRVVRSGLVRFDK